RVIGSKRSAHDEVLARSSEQGGEEKPREQADGETLRQTPCRVGDGQRDEDADERSEEIHQKNLVDIRELVDCHQEKMHSARVRSPRRVDLTSLLEQFHEIEMDIG